MKTYSGYIVEVKVRIKGVKETLYYMEGDTSLQYAYLSSDINHAEIFDCDVSTSFLRNFLPMLRIVKQTVKLLFDGTTVDITPYDITATRIIKVKREISTLEVK